jgi:ribosomal protein S18 acetylase RimI-like enzyme
MAAADARCPHSDAASVSELARVQAAIRADAVRSRDVELVGPFVATFDASPDNPFLNYAIPEADAEPARADVDALLAAYRARERLPRLEYVTGLAPAVESSLLEAGFAVEMRTPLLVFRGGRGDPPAPDGVELVDVSTADEAYAAGVAQNEAYEEAEPPTTGWVEGVLRNLATGGLRVLARDTVTGEPAGAGACTAPHDGACELHSVGVRAQYRRRGIAAALTFRLAERATANGVETIFLMAHGDNEVALYGRVGFEHVGEVLHISKR